MPIIITDPPPVHARWKRFREQIVVETKRDLEHLVNKAEELSPRETTVFLESWQIKAVSPEEMVILNDASRNGRVYAAYVKRGRDRLTVEEKVSRIINARTGVLARRLARRGAKALTGG